MKKLSPDTIEKLEWLKGRLRKYPHQYDQTDWYGKQACLAGYCFPKMLGKKSVTILYSTWLLEDLDWAEWLGVSEEETKLLDRAFWAGEAHKFNRLDSDSDEEAAEKACQRIDLFIQSGGTQ